MNPSDAANVSLNVETLIGYLMVFGGCTTNAVVMEYINRIQSNTNIFLTLVQFFFVSLFSYFIAIDKAGVRTESMLELPATNINQSDLWACAFLNLASSVLANLALDFDVPLPIHVIGRSTTVLFTIFVGYFFDKKKYEAYQLKCALAVTIGILLAATDTTKLFESFNIIISTLWNLIRFLLGYSSVVTDQEVSNVQSTNNVERWYYPWIGALLIFISMICQAFLASFQDRILKKALKTSSHSLGHSQLRKASSEASLLDDTSGISHAHRQSNPHRIENTAAKRPHWSVLLFYTHFYGIFPFVIATPIISATLKDIYNCYEKNTHGFFNIFTLIILYGLTQFTCVAGVYQLKKFFEPLYISIITNARKLITVVLSIKLFGHDFNIFKAIGSILVILGTVLYREPEPRKRD